MASRANPFTGGVRLPVFGEDCSRPDNSGGGRRCMDKSVVEAIDEGLHPCLEKYEESLHISPEKAPAGCLLQYLFLRFQCRYIPKV